jgi:hypothetical protein
MYKMNKNTETKNKRLVDGNELERFDGTLYDLKNIRKTLYVPMEIHNYTFKENKLCIVRRFLDVLVLFTVETSHRRQNANTDGAQGQLGVCAT